MKVRRKVTLLIEYDDERASDPAEWAWEELLDETVLHVESWPVVSPDLKVGDKVRLTGKDWWTFELYDEVVTITGGSEDDGTLWFAANGKTYAIYVDEIDLEDYSAEKVEDETEDLNIPGEPPLCLSKETGGLRLTCTRSAGHAGNHVAHGGLSGPVLAQWKEGE